MPRTSTATPIPKTARPRRPAQLAAGRPAVTYLRHKTATLRLKDVNAARRKERPPSGETSAGPVGYLYGTVRYWPDDSHEPEVHRAAPSRVTRKIAKRATLG